MLQSELVLLSHIASHIKSSGHFDAAYFITTPDQQATFNRLVDHGYITHKGNLGFSLTDLALAELYRHEQQLEQERNRKADEAAKEAHDDARNNQLLHKQFKHDWRITIVGSMLSFVLGLVVEYFSHIVSIASRLWNSFFH